MDGWMDDTYAETNWSFRHSHVSSRVSWVFFLKNFFPFSWDSKQFVFLVMVGGGDRDRCLISSDVMATPHRPSPAKVCFTLLLMLLLKLDNSSPHLSLSGYKSVIITFLPDSPNRMEMEGFLLFH